MKRTCTHLKVEEMFQANCVQSLTLVKPSNYILISHHLHLVSVTKYSDLKNKTACFDHQLIVDNCENDEMILPQQFTLGISTYKQCHDYIHQETLRNSTMRKECCKPLPTDQIKEFCLPTETAGIAKQMYREFISRCTGHETCELGRNVESGESHEYDYASMTYKCIKKTHVLFMNSSGLKSSENEVYLYNDQHGGHLNNITCVCYTRDCTGSLNISIVASKIAETKCRIISQEGNRTSTGDCKNLVADDTCPPTFHISSNYLIMSIIMMIDQQMTESQYLWLKVTGSNVRVACGSTSTSIIQNISCPTSTAMSSETSVTTRLTTASGTRTPKVSMTTRSKTMTVTSTGTSTANTTSTTRSMTASETRPSKRSTKASVTSTGTLTSNITKTHYTSETSEETGKGNPTTAGKGNTTIAGKGSPTIAGKGNPTIAGKGNPTIAGKGNPTIAGKGNPTIAGKGNPTIAGKGNKTIAGKGNPTIAGKGNPTIFRKGNPTIAGKGNPTIAGKGNPTIAVKGNPGIAGKGNPTIAGKGNPTIAGKGNPTIAGKGSPTIAGKENPTIVGKGNPTIAGKGNPTIAGKGNPTIAGKGNPTIAGKGNLTIAGKGNPTIDGKGNPTIAGKGNPTIAGKGNTAIPVKAYTTIAGKGNPTIAGKGNPTIAGKGIPTIAGKGNPTIAGKGNPTIAGKGNPTIAGKGNTTIAGKGNPTIAGKGNPTIAGKGNPTIAGKGNPTIAGKGNPTIAGKGNPTIAGKENAAVPLKVITVVGVSVGGVIILVLMGVTFVCVKKRNGSKHTGVHGLKDSELRKKNVERKHNFPSSSDDDDMFCDNPIYATDDYKIHVRDSKKSGDSRTSDDLEPEEDPYAMKPQEQPFGIALKLKRNSWVNADPPHFMMDLTVPETLANHDILDGEDRDKNGTVGGHHSQSSNLSAKSLADVDELYSKAIPKAKRKK